MKTTLLIASLLLAFTTAACNETPLQKYERDMVKVREAWAKSDAEREVKYQANSTRWAIEDNTRKLDELICRTRR